MTQDLLGTCAVVAQHCRPGRAPESSSEQTQPLGLIGICDCSSQPVYSAPNALSPTLLLLRFPDIFVTPDCTPAFPLDVPYSRPTEVLNHDLTLKHGPTCLIHNSTLAFIQASSAASPVYFYLFCFPPVPTGPLYSPGRYKLQLVCLFTPPISESTVVHPEKQ